MSRRLLIASGIFTALMLAAHVACTSWLAAHDPIALAGSHHALRVLAVGLVLFVARASLLLLPGYWLWLLVRSRFPSERPPSGAP